MTKKLVLNRETIRTLQPAALAQVAGGETGYVCYTWGRPTKLPLTDEWYTCGGAVCTQ